MDSLNVDRQDISNAASIVLEGKNFSGRTCALKRMVARFSGQRVSFVPAEVDHVISGLTTTVEDETGLGRSRRQDEIEDFAVTLQFGVALDRNPMTLSGGEKVQLALLCAFARGCEAVALDVVLEQLDLRRRVAAIRAINGMRNAGASVFAVDNRRLETWEHYTDTQLLVMAEGASRRPRLLGLMTDCFSDLLHPAESLTIRGLRFGYRRGEAILRDIEATLVPGKVYHLAGDNGAGKSTLAKLLVGRLRPWSGEIRFGGATVEPWRHPGQQVAYHFQDPDVQLFTRSVRSEIEASLRQWAGYAKPVVEVARRFGLGDVLDRHPFELESFVLRKRLALAVTLVSRAPWLILDEPTLGQDSESVEKIAGLVGLLASQGRGVVIISHSPSFIKCLRPVRLTLRDGVILAEGG